MSKEIRSVSFIGSGNVAYGLGMALKKVVEISGIWSRTYKNAIELARRLNCGSVQNINHLLYSDLIIVAVSDHAIHLVGEQLRTSLVNFKGAPPVIVHTSGSMPMNLLNPGGLKLETGVIYPLQTFTYGRRLSLREVPFFINGNRESTVSKLISLSEKVSSEVHFMNDDDRRKLHLPAVIVNNFVNHLIYLGEQVALEDGMKLDYFVPLIDETVKKIKAIGPYNAQTGPAKRNDIKVMSDQLKRLDHHPGLKLIYQLLSNSIKETYYEDHRRD